MKVNEQQLARGLGWFSIGLGLAELLAPRKVIEAVGVQRDGNEHLVQSLGLRELASGLGMLSSDLPAGWAWSRVAGDAMDLGLLGTALRSDNNDRGRLGGAMALVAGVTALDLICSLKLTEDKRQRHQHPGDTYSLGRNSDAVRQSITILKPANEIYGFWRRLENLPRFMSHLRAVEEQGDGRSRWVAKGPAGTEVDWEAQITEDRESQLIAWRSLPGSTVRNRGSVRFEPATGGRGTVVRVELEYRAPGGRIGDLVAKLFGKSPETQIRVELHRLKQLLETGEIARTRGQSAGRPTSTSPRYDEVLQN